MLKPAPAQKPTTTSQAPTPPPTPEKELWRCKTTYQQQLILWTQSSRACDAAAKKITMHEAELANLQRKEEHQHYLMNNELEHETVPEVLQARLNAKRKEIAGLRQDQEKATLDLKLTQEKFTQLHEEKRCQGKLLTNAQQQVQQALQKVQQAQEFPEKSLQSAEPQEDDGNAENAPLHEVSYVEAEYLEDASDPDLCLIGHALVDA